MVIGNPRKDKDSRITNLAIGIGAIVQLCVNRCPIQPYRVNLIAFIGCDNAGQVLTAQHENIIAGRNRAMISGLYFNSIGLPCERGFQGVCHMEIGE